MVNARQVTGWTVVGILALGAYFGWKSLGPLLVERAPDSPGGRARSEEDGASLEPSVEADPESDPRVEAEGFEFQESTSEPDVDREMAPAPAVGDRGPRLVDRLTGEPVPAFRVDHLRGTEPTVPLVTDSDGFLPEPLVVKLEGESLQAMDHPELADSYATQRWDLGAIGSVHDGTQGWKVHVGPTFSIALEGNEGRAPAEFRVTLAPWDLAFPTPEDRWSHAPLREGPLPWVRFAPVAPVVRMQDPPTPLLVRSRDGLLAGEGVARRYEGIEDTPVPVRLGPTTALRGVVETSEGQPIAGVQVDLEHDDRSMDPIRRRRQVPSGADGSFFIGGIPPGPYELGHRSKDHDAHAEKVELAAGVESFARLVLVETARGGSIAGRVTSETGAFQGTGHVRIVSADGRHRVFNAPIEWGETPGGWVGAYRLEDLPQGEYNVSVRSDSWYRFDPPVASVLLPSETTDFLCMDAVPQFDLSFELKDAETGKPIDPFQFAVEREGGRTQYWTAVRGEVLLPSIPRDTRILWSVEVPGYGKEYGDIHDFRRKLTDGTPEHWVCDLELEAGWSERLIAVDNQAREPVAGVQILLDGEPAGVTDAKGRVDLRADAFPERISIQAGEFFLLGGDVDRDTGRAVSRFGLPLEIIVARVQ